MLVRALTILFALSLAGCGIFPKEKSKDDSDSPNDHSGQVEDGPIELRQFLLVREPGMDEFDTAAVFILQPNRGTLEITDVKGPKYLGDAAKGQLDAESLKKLFVDISSPLPEAEKQKLLTDYPGAAIVYFEHYRGTLCNTDKFTVELTGEIEGLKPVAVYEFAGSTGSDGNCAFTSLHLSNEYSDEK